VNADLGQVLLTAVVTAVVGLLVTESYQTTPWLAEKLMRWSVCLRYTGNPERAKVRGEELISLLEDLPTLFKLPTAGGFLLRALAYRLANRRSHARREPRAGQRSLEARFRIALVKAGLVVVCTGTVYALEFALVKSIVSRDPSISIGGGFLTWGLEAGGLAAIVARSPRFYHGLIGGTLFTFTWWVVSDPSILLFLPLLLSGVASAVATALTCALIRKFKYVGVVIGALVNIVGITLLVLSLLLFRGVHPVGWLVDAVDLSSGRGFAIGALAGIAATIERYARGKYPSLAARRQPGVPGRG